MLEKCRWLPYTQRHLAFNRPDIHFDFVGPESPLPHSLSSCRQVHGTQISQVSEAPALIDDADGLWTMGANIPLGIKTADCLPILIATGTLVMGLHAGWRGFVGGICTQALEILGNHNIALSEIKVAIGPAISSTPFEVGPEVFKAYIEGSSLVATETARWHCLQKGKDDRWHLDLQTAAVLEYLSAKIPATNIAIIRHCTYNSTVLNSYRRTGSAQPTNWSWIVRRSV